MHLARLGLLKIAQAHCLPAWQAAAVKVIGGLRNLGDARITAGRGRVGGARSRAFP